MKRVVLYAANFEPITVINLQDCVWQYLHRYGCVNLEIFDEPSTSISYEPPTYTVSCVHIIAEKLVRGNQETLMLFTTDEESALKLKSAFSPGLQSTVNQLKSNAFAHGFMSEMKKLGR